MRSFPSTRFLPNFHMSVDIRRLIVKNLDDILPYWILIDSDSKIIDCSSPVFQQLGFHSSEIVQKPFTALSWFEETDPENFLESLIMDCHSGAVINRRTKLKQKNEIIINVEFSMRRLKHGEKECWLFTYDSITEVVELQKIVNAKMGQMYDKFNLQDTEATNYLIFDIIDAVLVSITAGQGLKFNRSFLFFVDEEKNSLIGVRAIGPNSGEEAEVIYRKFEDAPKTLKKMIEHYKKLHNTDSAVNRLVTQISIPLSDSDNILIATLHSKKYTLANNQSLNRNVSWIQKLLTVAECLIVPLIWHGQSIGIIIVDNQVTRSRISNSNISALTRVATTAANAIQSIRLLINLDKSMSQVKQANLKISEGQAMLLQKERLAAMGELVAHMAHEVRGPLATIGGFAARTFKQMKRSDSHYDSLRRITETVSMLELVINDILDGSMPVPAPNKVSDCTKAIHKVLNLLEEDIHTRKITVDLKIQGQLPEITIEEHHLFQIMYNLVKNALEAMVQNGLLHIQARSLSDRVILVIKDTGPGIASRDFEKLFQPFYTTKSEGTGLGLVVVKKLVEESGGTIEVKTSKSKGTDFIISFPVKK